MKSAVIAIGGNALIQAGQKGTPEEQWENVLKSSEILAEMIEDGYEIVISHGNGPQVGNILIQNDEAKNLVPPQTLDICGAESQGLIGYMLQQSLQNVLNKKGIRKTVVSMVTQTLVDVNDSAFENPSKPVGPFYKPEQAESLMKEKKWIMKEDKARGGFRRVVPSPFPIDIIEKKVIKKLIFGSSDFLVIASGGGGIPVVNDRGVLRGVEAVIDKDLATGVLANSIGEKLFIILTDVEFAYINFNTPQQKKLEKLTLDEMQKYYDEGHFSQGSMGPKVNAALTFLRQGGEKVIISSLEKGRLAISEKTGTIITRN